jgi:hypothetical protein
VLPGDDGVLQEDQMGDQSGIRVRFFKALKATPTVAGRCADGGRTWRDQQMDVIGHEDIGVDAAAIALRAASANQYGIGRSRQTTVAP